MNRISIFSKYASFLTLLICVSLGYAQGPSSRAESRIDDVYSSFNLSGDGVLAVIMDRGIDYRHPDFIDENGKTRIAYIFDMYDNTGANDPDNPYGIGTVHTADEINAALDAGGEPIANDIFGHGTATTGIVCGNGTAIANNELYRGVAYNATIISIIVTKDYVPPFQSNPGQPGQFNPQLLATGFQFASDKIDELDMPAVTLLNIGSVGNPSDGTDSFCSLSDNYVAQGHAFVCGVGDDGGSDNHAIPPLTLNQTTELVVQKGEDGFLRQILWYSEDDRIELSVERPDGSIEGPFPPPDNANDSKDNFLDKINIYHRGANTEFSGSTSNLRMIMIDFSGENGSYTLHLTPTQKNSTIDAHAFLNPGRHYNENKFLTHVVPGHTINSYSSCLSSISPTDYVANNTWTDVDGIPRSIIGQGNPGQLWKGSSAGPTMDGRYGTDIASPGELAVGAYSLDSYYGNFAFNTMEFSQGYYGIQNAVSGAAPIVTGVIALMLEADPSLSPDQIKTILQESAKSDSFTGSVPNNQWGYGKMDAFEAIKAILPDAVEPSIRLNDKVTIQPNPADQMLTLKMDEAIDIKGIQISNPSGNVVLDLSGPLPAQINISELNSGFYFISITTDQGQICKKFIKN